MYFTNGTSLQYRREWRLKHRFNRQCIIKSGFGITGFGHSRSEGGDFRYIGGGLFGISNFNSNFDIYRNCYKFFIDKFSPNILSSGNWDFSEWDSIGSS